MAKRPVRPKANPLVDKLASLRGEDEIVELQGYVGTAPPGCIRLYDSLSLTRYVDLDERELLHVEAGKDDRAPVRAFVPGHASLRVTTTRTERLPATRLAASTLGFSGPGTGIIGPLPPPRLPPRFLVCLEQCGRAYQRCLETNPLLESDREICDREFARCMSLCLRETSGVIGPT